MRSAILFVLPSLVIACSSDSNEDDHDASDGSAADRSDASDAGFDDDVEGSADFPPGQPDVDELPGSDVSGFVVRIDGTLQIVASAADGQPVDGATVVLLDLDGHEVARATTDVGGRFAVDDVARGPISATASAGTDASAPLYFSSLPDSQVVLGETWPIERVVAAGLAGSRNTSTELILGTLQPLPAGTVVAPRREDPLSSEFAVALETPAWFFVFDAEPFVRQQHALTYVFVDAVSGAVRTISDAPEWPRINRGVYFTDDVMWASFAAVDWDEAFDSGVIDPDAVAVPSAEVISLPQAIPAELTDGGGGMPKPGDPSARDVFVAMLIAGNDSASSADRVRMWRWCDREGIPIGNRRVVIPHEIARIRDVPTQWAQALRELEELVVAALDEGRRPTLLVYVTGHGLLDNGSPARQLRVDWKDREMEWSASNIDAASLISNTSACRLRVVFDVCFAETLALDLEVRTVRRPLNERPDFFSLSSSVSDQRSIMIPGWLGAIAGSGSIFTMRFAEHVSVVAADLSGALAPGNAQINDNLDPAGQTPIAHITSNWPSRCDDAVTTDTGVSLDAGSDDVVDPVDVRDNDVSAVDAGGEDASSTTRRVATLAGPERAFVLNVGGLPWDPPFAGRSAEAAHVIVGGAGGVELINLATGSRITNPFAPANFAAVPFRDPRGYESFLLPGPGGLALSSWNPDAGDFGFTQLSPNPTPVFDVDVLSPDESGTSSAYVYATSNTETDSGNVVRQSYDAVAGYMRVMGEVRADAFPDGTWPAAPFGAYFGRTPDEVVVTLLDGSVWVGAFSGPVGTEPAAMTRVFSSEGEPRGLRCVRTTSPPVCVMPSYESSQLHVIELDEGTVSNVATLDVAPLPVGIAVVPVDATHLDIAAASSETGEVEVFGFDTASETATSQGRAYACSGAAHVDFVGTTELVVTCHDSDELVLLPRTALR